MAGISITLAGNFQKLDELKDKAGKTASSIKSSFKSITGSAAFGGVAIAATAAFAGVVAAVKSAVDAGGELNDMMARTGAAGKGLVIMQRAFENAGMAASQVPQALNKMQKSLAGVNEEGEPTNEAFAKLGLSIADLLTLDPVEAFKRTAEAIASIQSAAQRTAVVMEIFGKSGGEMLAVLTDPAAFSGAAEQVGSLGDTLADNAAKLDAVGDAFGALDTKVQQIGAEVAVSLLPQLEALGQWLNETDFSAVGGGIGIIVEKIASLGEMLAEVSQYMPLMMLMNKMADLTVGGAADPEKAKKMLAEWQANDPMHGKSRVEGDAQKQATAAQVLSDTESAKGAKGREKEAKDAERAAKAVEKKADAAAKAAEDTAKSRAAALDEYNLESAILSARLAGDAKRIESLEREKKIREEMAKLTQAGFTADEARKPSEAKVDAEAKIEAKKKEHEENDKIRKTLEGKIEDNQGKQDSLHFESTVGAISSMQRIGGGGGAVGSGLDYQRQAADLQREGNELTRQLIELNRRDTEV